MCSAASMSTIAPSPQYLLEDVKEDIEKLESLFQSYTADKYKSLMLEDRSIKKLKGLITIGTSYIPSVEKLHFHDGTPYIQATISVDPYEITLTTCRKHEPATYRTHRTDLSCSHKPKQVSFWSIDKPLFPDIKDDVKEKIENDFNKTAKTIAATASQCFKNDPTILTQCSSEALKPLSSALSAATDLEALYSEFKKETFTVYLQHSPSSWGYQVDMECPAADRFKITIQGCWKENSSADPIDFTSQYVEGL